MTSPTKEGQKGKKVEDIKISGSVEFEVKYRARLLKDGNFVPEIEVWADGDRLYGEQLLMLSFGRGDEEKVKLIATAWAAKRLQEIEFAMMRWLKEVKSNFREFTRFVEDRKNDPKCPKCGGGVQLMRECKCTQAHIEWQCLGCGHSFETGGEHGAGSS